MPEQQERIARAVGYVRSHIGGRTSRFADELVEILTGDENELDALTHRVAALERTVAALLKDKARC